MAECFCGCGQKVAIASKGMNKQGRRTLGLLAKLRLARDNIQHPENGDVPPRLVALVAPPFPIDHWDVASIREHVVGTLDALIDSGERFEGFWTDAVHDVYLPQPGEALQKKRAWQAWARAGLATVEAAGVPPAKGWRAVLRGEV